MKKVPTKLKQLAERRARVVGELNAAVPLEQLADQIAIFKLQLADMESLLLVSTNKQERLLKELADIDKRFLEEHPTVSTVYIAPIAAWKGKYGKRGELKNFVYDTLKARSPSSVPTNELAILVITKFSLVFADRKARKIWYDHSLRGALDNLLKAGLAEKSENYPCARNKTLGYWKLKQDYQPTLADLVAQADTIVAADH